MTFLYLNMNLQSLILNVTHRYYESDVLGTLYKRLRVLSFNSIYDGFSCTSFIHLHYYEYIYYLSYRTV